MPKIFTSKTQKIGELGENLAVRFLVKHDFTILERNYTKKWGEIDIVAEKEGKLYFIEVKSVSRQTLKDINKEALDEYHPEDNMHQWKLERLSKTVRTYLMEKELEEKEWQVDLLVIFLSEQEKKARIKVVKDIIL